MPTEHYLGANLRSLIAHALELARVDVSMAEAMVSDASNAGELEEAQAAYASHKTYLWALEAFSRGKPLPVQFQGNFMNTLATLSAPASPSQEG